MLLTPDFISGTLCIHSGSLHGVFGEIRTQLILLLFLVVIKPELRRKGLATQMMKQYVQYIKANRPEIQSIALISKLNIIPLYESSGFTLIGPSDVVHGADVWYELRLDIPRQ